MAFSRNLSKTIRRKLRALPEWWVILLVILILSAIILAWNIYLDRNWLHGPNALYLIGLVFGQVVAVVGIFLSWLYKYRSEFKVQKLTRNSLSNVSERNEAGLRPRLVGIPRLLNRDETQTVVEQIGLGKNIILTGEAGTGKSGIGIAVKHRQEFSEAFVIYLDARDFIGITDLAGLRQFFDIQESLHEGIERLGLQVGVLIILDQLDNIAGSRGGIVLTDFLLDCARLPDVQIVILSRHNETNERGLLQPLLDSGFNEVICGNLNEETAEEVLLEVGIQEPSKELISLCRNLLNLELACIVARRSGPEELADVIDENDLWDLYRIELCRRESERGAFTADEFMAVAVDLARQGLTTLERTVSVDFPITAIQRRLISSGVLVVKSGREHSFVHERLQDYLYAWDATQRGLLPAGVYSEIDDLHARNVLIMMQELYKINNPEHYEQFLERVLENESN